ncbi:MAG: DNA-formamidopyrimidine glycosylase family protein [Candidatus Paceibacterota bacterium]
MPELPDVESFTRYFERTSLNQEIEEVIGETKSLVKGTSFKKFREKLIGEEFVDARRRGKFLIAEVSNTDEKVVFHFGMTGSLSYSRQRGSKFGRDEYAQVTFKFEQGYELRWINIRKLGKIYFVKKPERIDLIKEMGPEPLSLSEDSFLELLEEHERKNVKTFLMDQRDIAGIGNIYSDEILFQAEIDPHHNIKDLDEEKRKELYQKMKNVLIEASNLSHPGAKFPNSWLTAHREEMECPNYKTHELTKETIGGRTARFCDKCQS